MQATTQEYKDQVNARLQQERAASDAAYYADLQKMRSTLQPNQIVGPIGSGAGVAGLGPTYKPWTPQAPTQAPMQALTLQNNPSMSPNMMQMIQQLQASSGQQPSTSSSGQQPSTYGNQGMFGGTASYRAPYTSYQQYQPYGGQNYSNVGQSSSSGMFGAPVSNSNWQAGNTQQQNTGWSQNNPYSMKRW